MRLLRALAALVTSLALLAGIPVLLARTIGNPLQSWPDVVAGDLSDRTILAILGAVAYLAWAQFALAFLAELGAQLWRPPKRPSSRNSRRPKPVRVPFTFGFQRHFAHHLVAAILLLSTGASLTTGILPDWASTTVAAAQAATTHHAPLTAIAPTPARQQVSPSHQAVERITIPDDGSVTWWDLAEIHLGSGDRWPEVWALNEGSTQPDGAILTKPGLLHPGWVVAIPAPADGDGHDPGGRDVIVEPGDSLSKIAAENGVSGGWRELWQANKGRSEPDGQRLTNADEIWPGWVVTIPAPTTTHQAPASPPSATPATPTAAAPTSPNDPDSAPDLSADPPPGAETPPDSIQAWPTPPELTPAPEASPAPAPQLAPTPSSEPASPNATAQSSAQPPPQDNGPDTEAAAVGDQNASHLAVPLIAGGASLVLAGACALALNRHRRRQSRYRRPGHGIPTIPAHLKPMERSLRISADTAAWQVNSLDGALRQLARQSLTDPAWDLPDPIAAHLTPGVITLHLAQPHHHPPIGWHATEDGTTWTYSTHNIHPAPVPADVAAPYPLLVTLGHTATGEPWLVDLERIGHLCLTGNRQASRNLALFIGAELAHVPWSEMAEITVIGLGNDLAALNPDRLACTDTPSGDTQAASNGHQYGSDSDSSVSQTILADRIGRTGREADTPRVLITADTSKDAAPIVGRTARAIVRVAEHVSLDVPPQHGWVLKIAEDCTVTIPGLDIEIVAEQLPPEEARAVAALLATAATISDQPTPAGPPAAWAKHADAAGNVAVGDCRRRPEPTDLDGDPMPVDSVLPMSTTTYEQHTATTAADLDELAPMVAPDVRHQIEAALTDLDRDLADWRDPASTRPRISVLGPITVRARGSLPSDKPREAWNTEVVTYLATVGHPVTPDEYGTALWPDDPDITRKPKLRQSIHIARRWLGISDRTGLPHLPAHPGSSDITYQLDDALLDADLFRQLRLRGVSRGPAGLPDLQAALDLVGGTPFDRRRPGGYSWLTENALDHQYTAMITDLAHTLATAYLANGDPQRAAHAANVALRAGTTADIPLLDLMQAHYALGHDAQATECLRRILANHDAEVEEDLPPRTFEILHRNGWLSGTQPSAHNDARSQPAGAHR